MGIIGRIEIGAGLMGAGAIGGTFWLYLVGFADPLVVQHAGIWSEQWELFQWTIPTACVLSIVAGGLYLVYGGAQEERAEHQRRVRRR